MDWSKSLEQGKDFISRDLGDEVVLMTPDGQEIHSFEDTGLWVWTKITEGMTPDEIIAEMINEYDVVEDQAKEDFSVFIADLKEKGILKK